MEKWTSLNSSALAHEVAKDSVFNEPYSGQVIFTLPPYDVPKAMRAFVDEGNQNILVIEFQYGAVTEKKNVKEPRSGIIFFVGEKTGRIHKVCLDAEQLPNGFSFRIDGNHLDPQAFGKALDSLLGAEPSLSQYQDKYNANKSAIKQFNQLGEVEYAH